MKIDRINPSTLPKPTGYTHVALVSSARQVHVAGQVAVDAAGNLVGKGDLAAQTEQVYLNLTLALAAVGADFSHVFKMVTYVVDLSPDKVLAVRAVRGKYLNADILPASTLLGVTALAHPDYLIEIEVIAALD